MNAKVEAPRVHLYPDGGGYYLRQGLAKHLGVEMDNLILANGSNEVVEFLAHAFLNTVLFLDYDRQGFPYPVIPFQVNCYGRRVIAQHGVEVARQAMVLPANFTDNTISTNFPPALTTNAFAPLARLVPRTAAACSLVNTGS